jgi:hypothetical protein
VRYGGPALAQQPSDTAGQIGSLKQSIEHFDFVGAVRYAQALNLLAQQKLYEPKMSLAAELLAGGEIETVVEYFSECGVFWKFDNERLALWTAVARAGGMPDFGTNLFQ